MVSVERWYRCNAEKEVESKAESYALTELRTRGCDDGVNLTRRWREDAVCVCEDKHVTTGATSLPVGVVPNAFSIFT